MDNRFFNVNGKTKEQLKLALELLLFNEYGEKDKVAGWYFSKQKGFVLTWANPDKHKSSPFTNRLGQPEEIDVNELLELLWKWKDTEQASTVELEDFEDDADHEGSNDKGWRLYTEKWGHIEEGSSIDHYSIAAFKPVWLWYGK